MRAQRGLSLIEIAVVLMILSIVAAFVVRAEQGYIKILRALEVPSSSRADLARAYRQVRTIDYFHAPSGELVRARLESEDK